MPVTVPATGTIRILVGVVASRDGDFQSGFPAGNCAADILSSMSSANIDAYLNANGAGLPAPNSRWTNAVYCNPTCFGLFAAAGLHRLTFNPATNEIIFNPGGSQIVIDFLSSDFPMGVIVSALQVHFYGSARDFGGGNDIVNFELRYNGLVVHSVAVPNLLDAVVESSTTAVIPFGQNRGFLSALGIFGVGVTHQANSIIGTSCGDFPTSAAEFRIRELYVQGNYAIWSSSVRVSPGVTNEPYTTNSPVGTEFVITTNVGDGNLTEFVDIIIYSEDSSGNLFGGTTVPAANILSRTATKIRFIMPAFTLGSSGSRLVVAGTGNGAAFTDPIYVGYILPVLVNGSGIYTLVPGRKYDTYYDRSGSVVGTVDMAIPNPKFKTGYFGG